MLKREVIIVLILLIVGVVILPLPIYWIGQQIIGEYPSEQGLWGLTKAIWTDLGRASPLAWLLVFSPYLVVQMLRIGWSVWREGKIPWISKLIPNNRHQNHQRKQPRDTL